nr:hypothetical protein CFP56_75895 [Quercus suber]
MAPKALETLEDVGLHKRTLSHLSAPSSLIVPSFDEKSNASSLPTAGFEQLEHQLVDQSSVIDICYATIPQQDSGAKKPSWI